MPLWSMGLLIILAAIAATTSLDRETRTLLEMHYAGRHGMWREVLQKARQLPVESCGMYVLKDVNRALYHTGRLGQEMFTYPQRYDRDSMFLTFAIPQGRAVSSEKLSEMYFELGFINDAEHFAHETLEHHGRSPEILKRLARINILKGLPTAGRTFIGALGKNFLYRKWAREYLRRLDADPAMTDDEELTNARKRMVRGHYETGTGGAKQMVGPLLVRILEQRLWRGRGDKMAFEYLMAHYLLTGQLAKVATTISRLGEFDYPGIPRHYEEALLLYVAAKPGREVQLPDRQISQHTRDRFQQFTEAIYRTGQDRPKLRQTILTNYDKSYFTIAAERIDSHLAYRLITPIYSIWQDVGIYQRDLESFDQSVILHNRSFGSGCVNCHTFYKNNPAEMLMNVRPNEKRDPPDGMVVVRNGAVANVVNTKTTFNPIPAIYLAWHPNGKLIAFSTNKITQFFHSVGENRDVFDHRSDLGLYRLEGNTVTTSTKISQPRRMETYPTWSPDGKYLYFCSAPQMPIRQYRQVRYDLMRISYDAESDTWGEVETVLGSAETHLSITHPRISPDGRWLLFCMCNYGNFSIYHPESDL